MGDRTWQQDQGGATVAPSSGRWARGAGMRAGSAPRTGYGVRRGTRVDTVAELGGLGQVFSVRTGNTRVCGKRAGHVGGVAASDEGCWAMRGDCEGGTR